jgi:hypothetical protein
MSYCKSFGSSAFLYPSGSAKGAIACAEMPLKLLFLIKPSPTSYSVKRGAGELLI